MVSRMVGCNIHYDLRSCFFCRNKQMISSNKRWIFFNKTKFIFSVMSPYETSSLPLKSACGASCALTLAIIHTNCTSSLSVHPPSRPHYSISHFFCSPLSLSVSLWTLDRTKAATFTIITLNNRLLLPAGPFRRYVRWNSKNLG